MLAVVGGSVEVIHVNITLRHVHGVGGAAAEVAVGEKVFALWRCPAQKSRPVVRPWFSVLLLLACEWPLRRGVRAA